MTVPGRKLWRLSDTAVGHPGGDLPLVGQPDASSMYKLRQQSPIALLSGAGYLLAE